MSALPLLTQTATPAPALSTIQAPYPAVQSQATMPPGNGRHGNFHPDVYLRVCGSREWSKRLEKVHTASKRSRVRANWQWKELDCANSSDALLMNILCHPEVVASTRVRMLLGIESNLLPEFGFEPRTPLKNSRRDNTEVDMKIDSLLAEAKLTESDFKSKKRQFA